MSMALSLLVSTLANSGDCQTAGTTCTGEDAMPASGEALLQLSAVFPATAHPEESTVAKRSAKSLMQAEEASGLPAEAKNLFNEKLCNARPATGPPKSPKQKDLFDGSSLTPKPPKQNDLFNGNSLLGESNGLGTKSLNTESEEERDDQQLQPMDSSFSKSFLDDFALEDTADNQNLQSLSASLDQAGFAKVRHLANAEEMAMFIRRVAESCNMMVIDEGGLNGAVDWFKNPDDAGASFETLKADLFRALLAASKDHWVTVKDVHGITAETATPDLVGYVQVRALRKKEQMRKFVKRMISEMGIKITDMDGFNGLMAYYTEPDDSQSFAKLLGEIKKAAYERNWAEMA
jgi:hypothetical protein